MPPAPRTSTRWPRSQDARGRSEAVIRRTLTLSPPPGFADGRIVRGRAATVGKNPFGPLVRQPARHVKVTCIVISNSRQPDRRCAKARSWRAAVPCAHDRRPGGGPGSWRCRRRAGSGPSGRGRGGHGPARTGRHGPPCQALPRARGRGLPVPEGEGPAGSRIRSRRQGMRPQCSRAFPNGGQQCRRDPHRPGRRAWRASRRRPKGGSCHGQQFPRDFLSFIVSRLRGSRESSCRRPFPPDRPCRGQAGAGQQMSGNPFRRHPPMPGPCFARCVRASAASPTRSTRAASASPGGLMPGPAAFPPGIPSLLRSGRQVRGGEDPVRARNLRTPFGPGSGAMAFGWA